MMYPPIQELLDKTGDCRYALVVQVSKRARQLVQGEECLVYSASDKPVTMAVAEIHEGKVWGEAVAL